MLLDRRLGVHGEDLIDLIVGESDLESAEPDAGRSAAPAQFVKSVEGDAHLLRELDIGGLPHQVLLSDIPSARPRSRDLGTAGGQGRRDEDHRTQGGLDQDLVGASMTRVRARQGETGKGRLGRNIWMLAFDVDTLGHATMGSQVSDGLL